MTWMRWTVAAATLVAIGGATLSLSAVTEAAKTGAPKGKLVARGEYLVTLGGCNDCHTPGAMYGAPDMERMLSGSEVGWRGPFGVTYASNLTPDPETGIGGWSEADIVKALKTGMRPDGSAIMPPMPWQNLARATDEDLRAIAAYLKSIPPVKHRNPHRVPPDQAASAKGSIVDLPPPPAWDAPAGGPDGGR
uniref:C-type cytochrome n=1 Tax=Eiseniibacteriota bacterium TaxID=2212470 RepID=A0A832IB82_UNCEI